MKWLVILLISAFDYNYIDSLINPDSFNVFGLVIFLCSIIGFLGYILLSYLNYSRKTKNVKIDNKIKKIELNNKKQENIKKESEDNGENTINKKQQ